jgi:Ser/Thr protein kinase RdoA (MazF antagonist)
VGTLHRHAETFRLPDDLHPKPWTGETLAEDFPLTRFESVYGSDDLSVISEAVTRAGQTLLDIGAGPEACGLIHGDLHQMNYMFDGFDARAIDFESPSSVCYLFDIAVTLAYLRDMPMSMTHEVPARLYDALEDAYYQGYTVARELPAGYVRHVEVLKIVKLLINARWIASSPNIRRMTWTQRYMAELPVILRRLLSSDDRRADAVLAGQPEQRSATDRPPLSRTPSRWLTRRDTAQ